MKSVAYYAGPVKCGVLESKDMDKSSKYYLILPIVGILLTIGAFQWLRANSPIFNLFFPPTDFYTTLAESPIIFEQAGYVLDMKFKNKRYPGGYALIIQTEKPLPKAGGFRTKIKANIKVKKDNIIILQKTVSKPRSYFWKNEKESGFYLFQYQVPTDLPKNVELNLEMTLLEPDKEIFKKYGKTKAIIRKTSDK